MVCHLPGPGDPYSDLKSATDAFVPPTKPLACLGMGGVNRLGLGRAALAQEDRQDDQCADRQKLALPVLKAFEPELWTRQSLDGCFGWRAVEQRFFIGVPGAAQQMQPEG